jgi:hypothetical protein
MPVEGSVARMRIAPGVTERPVATPLDPAAFEMETAAPPEELHVTEAVMFCVVPSLYVPIAVKDTLAPVER